MSSSPLARWRAPVTALGLILVVVGAAWTPARLEPLSIFDQPFYLGIASDIRHFGRFTDGFVFAENRSDGTRPAGMRFAPLYPALLATAATLDPGFGEALDCVVLARAVGTGCPNHATLVRAVQGAMLAAFFFLIWHMASTICRSAGGAWFALGSALTATSLLLRYVDYAMTEITSVFLFTAAVAAAVAACRDRRRAKWLAVAGVLLGLTALTRPAFFYLCLAAGAVGLIAALRLPANAPAPADGHVSIPGDARVRPRLFRTEQDEEGPSCSRRRGLLLAGAFVLGMALPICPWILRNAVVLGHPALTRGYDSHTLVQRLSFDAMSWREYGASFLCWLPNGTGLGEHLLGPHACDRFGWDERPDTFYSIGAGDLMQQTVAAAGGWDRHLSYLIRTYVLADPVKYAAVTVSLALRGAWINHYWGLILMPICAVLTAVALRRRAWVFLVVALPAWFMLIFNAAVSVNQVRYNLVLIPAFAIAGAVAFEWALGRRRLGSRRSVEVPKDLPA